eukprot:TRINITY_DN4593_c0_g2_i4.p1 TRINITY_DN4593_c0_g2~~TRINITY_DN4593_c0_g2_i4.p1  ORF type:complete len:279 (+),score=33.44 TRINITY_DN4593_c0_g2_i4:159-995(+)
MQVDPKLVNCLKHYTSPKYHYTSIMNAIRTIYSQEGIKGLWRGNLLAELMWGSFGALQFGSFSLYSKLFNPYLQSEETRGMTTLLCGACAGATATVVVYPLDLLRTRFAAQGVPQVYVSIPQAVSTIYRTNGFKGFYYGICPSLWQFVPYVSLQFFIYKELQQLLLQKNLTGPWISPLCGGIAGGTAKLVSFPLDVLKKRLQIHGLNLFRAGENPTRCPYLATTAKQMYRVEGFRAFYKGLLPSLAKSTLQATIVFTLYEYVQKQITARYASNQPTVK